MRKVKKIEDKNREIESVNEIENREAALGHGWEDARELKTLHMLVNLKLGCPYCDQSVLFEHDPKGKIRFVSCRKCGWIGDFDYIQDILEELDPKVWELRPESLVLNPFIVCPKCDESGMAEFLSNFREVKTIGCLRCGWLTNKGLFEEHRED